MLSGVIDPHHLDPHDEVDLASGWRNLVLRSHLPAAIRRHLQAERALLAALLATGAHRLVIEAGCADGSLLLPVVLAAGLDYLGVDVVDGAVAATSHAIARTPLAPGQHAVAVRGDVRALDAVAAARSGALRDFGAAGPALVVLPFNLMGIVSRPETAFASVAAIGADIAVFTYRRSTAAGSARADYFRRAGWPGAEVAAPDVTHFEADHFVSSVYGEQRLRSWLVETGFEPEIRPYGEIGLAAIGRRPVPAVPAVPVSERS